MHIMIIAAIVVSVFVICSTIVLFPSAILSSTDIRLQTNMSTKCENGNCTTTICINDEPCETANLDSKNMSSLGDLLKNKTIVGPTIPREII
jgi:hypothetical protein